MASLIMPFVPREDLQAPYEMLTDFLERLWEWWDENAKFRERIGELIERVGMRVLLKDMGIKAVPQMVTEPRSNPYYFWWPEDLGLAPKEKDAEEDDD